MSRELSEDEIMELNDQFEYDIVSILDKEHGGVDVERMSEVIAAHASKGWRLAFTVPNEIGHDSSMSELDGISIGINSTIDQNVLIFERCIHRYGR
ncbi:MAG: hypothetical protein IKS85_04745 [Lachnospiraceae bacterium]|nr:hypothetical protein [Lachnospiraceae bacterium]